MFCMHPVILGISAAAAAVYYAVLKGARALKKLAGAVVLFALFPVLLNPLFSHNGNTVLFLLPGGKEFTLESLLYGLVSGVLMAAVMLWFCCFSAVITGEKTVFLFGRLLPSLSLVLSMTLRFIPEFTRQFAKVSEARAGLGRGTSDGKPIRRIRNAADCFSAVVTYSLENSADTADCMKSRGFGTGRRTSYSVYAFESRDKTALVFIAVCALSVFCAAAAGAFAREYYPAFSLAAPERETVFSYVMWTAVCFMPVILYVKEEAEWKRSRSKL